MGDNSVKNEKQVRACISGFVAIDVLIRKKVERIYRLHEFKCLKRHFSKLQIELKN